MKEVWAGRLAYIYGIVCRDQLVYVGRTTLPCTRFMAHRNVTFKSVRDNIKMVILECCPERLADYQEYVWINKAIDRGCNLANKLLPKHIQPPEKRDMRWCRASERGYFYPDKPIPSSFMANTNNIAPATLRGYEKGKEAFLAKAQAVATALSVKVEDLI